jgi:hypothetical protein
VTGEAGTVIKSMNNCLWVRMDDGRELSGAKQYWRNETKKDERLKREKEERVTK